MENEIGFSYVKVIEKEEESYSIAVVVGNKFHLLPFTAKTMEQLMDLFAAVIRSLPTKEHITEITVSDDGTKMEKIEAIPNPFYVKQE